MHTRAVIGVIAIVAIAAVGLWRWRSRPTTTASVATAAGTGERVRPAGCDPLPAPPPLPATFTPKTPTVDGVVAALDTTLGPEQKAFLRCFPDDDELVARVHFGLGRWLRGTLHLYRPGPLVTALRAAGAKDPDDMSALIVRAYARSLAAAPRAAK